MSIESASLRVDPAPLHEIEISLERIGVERLARALPDGPGRWMLADPERAGRLLNAAAALALLGVLLTAAALRA